jgi:hypothetical protein|nr:MAG TPA_asm: hypothetical protein [Caudoviricetes sp.]
MIITFKEFKDKVRNTAIVCFGSFRFDEAEETKGREVSIHRFGKSVQYQFCAASCIFDLPLADSYKMDVYTEHEYYGYGSFYGTYYVKEDTSADFNANKFFIIAPNFLADIEKAYKRKNDYKHCCINNYVISSVSVACATWMRLTDYLKGKNEVEFLDGSIRIGVCEKDEMKRAAKVHKYIGFAEKAFKKYLEKNGLADGNEYLDMLAHKAAEKKEAEKAAKKAEKARAKELAYINDHIFIQNKWKSEAYKQVINRLNTGSHLDELSAYIGRENGINCYESRDFDGYSKSCRFPMIRRSFSLYLKKGYNIHIIGGLITFVRGEIKRQGVACEWVEQGRAIDDIETVKGFLVRGEHIVAKSLKEAQRINAEKRNKQALSLLNARSKDQLVYQKLGNHMFTFEESLASGNCRPGTQGFKNRYEAAIGHEATEISLADLRKYGKKFGLEAYTERVIRYVMNKL